MEKSKLAKMALSALVLASAMTAGAHAEGTSVLLASAACGGGTSAPSYSSANFDQYPSSGCGNATRPSRRGQFSRNTQRNQALQQQNNYGQAESQDYAEDGHGYGQNSNFIDTNSNNGWSGAPSARYTDARGNTVYEENWADRSEPNYSRSAWPSSDYADHDNQNQNHNQYQSQNQNQSFTNAPTNQGAGWTTAETTANTQGRPNTWNDTNNFNGQSSNAYRR